MLFKSVLCASAFAAFANAQTIVTSSAASVAASTTVSQVMPPAATQGFDISNVTSSTLCESLERSIHVLQTDKDFQSIGAWPS